MAEAKPHQLSQQDARRIALRAQLLTAERPTDLLETVRHLTLLPTEPTAPIATSFDLLLWSRLGSAYDPDELTQAVDDQVLVQYLGLLRPIEDLGLHRAEAPYWPGRTNLKQWQHDVADWVAANEECRQDILELLRAEGPLPATAIPDTCQRTWGSTGWTNNKNVQQMLWFMLQRDEVAVVGQSSGRGGSREALGPRRAGVRRGAAARPRRGAGGAGPPPPRRARHRPPDGTAGPRRTDVRARRRGAGRRRGGPRQVARRAVAARGPRRLRGPRGAAVAVRPPGDGPQAARRGVRVRLPAGDVQARRSSGSGATTRCRSCTATAWSGSSTPPPSATRACSASTRSTRTSRSRRRWPMPSTPRSRPSPPGSASR